MKANPIREMFSSKLPELFMRTLLSNNNASAVMEYKSESPDHPDGCRTKSLVGPYQRVRHAVAKRANEPSPRLDSVKMPCPFAERLVWRLSVCAHVHDVASPT